MDESQIELIRAEAEKLAECQNVNDARPFIDRMSKLIASESDMEVVSVADAFESFQARQSEPAPDYLPWGVESLDKRLYVQPGDFVVIGGYPSSGKTLLSLQFALEMSKAHRVGYFSFETGVEKLTDRVISHLAQVKLAFIKNKDLSDGQKKNIELARKGLSDRTLDFIDAAGHSLTDVKNTVSKNEYEVVFVDYLQLMKPPRGRYQNRYEQVTAISMGLHTMARQCKCAVIALAQLSRPEKAVGKPLPPTMSSFRESGQIEQDADVAMLLYPASPENPRSDRVLSIAKNKEGELYKTEMSFDGSKQTLTMKNNRRSKNDRK